MTFGERLKYRRQMLGMTLADLSSKVGKTDATLQRYESGSIKDPPHDMIVKLSKALHCDPNFLMGWVDEINETKQKVIYCENDDERELVKYFRTFDRRQQHELMARLYELSEKVESYAAKDAPKT